MPREHLGEHAHEDHHDYRWSKKTAVSIGIARLDEVGLAPDLQPHRVRPHQALTRGCSVQQPQSPEEVDRLRHVPVEEPDQQQVEQDTIGAEETIVALAISPGL